MEPDDTFPEDLADALAGLQRLIRRRLREGMTVPRLRGAEVDLLRLVEDHPGIGVSEAAKELYLAGNSVSTLVNQLVRDGFLTREQRGKWAYYAVVPDALASLALSIANPTTPVD